MPDKETRSRIELIIPWSTLLKVFIACLMGYAAIRLQRFFLLLLVAVLIALAFRPLLEWTQKRGWPKWVGSLLCGIVLVTFTGILFGVLIPAVSNQTSALIERLPRVRDDLLNWLPRLGPLRNLAEETLSRPPFSDPQPLMKYVLTWGSAAIGHVAEFLLVLVIAFYFIVDGAAVYRWLRAFLPKRHWPKADQAADEITSVVSHYIAGNLITSVLASVYAFVVLQLLHVPSAALLAILAGVFDLLPIIGFFLFTIPATLLALTVSTKAAVLVALSYGAYHLFENYVIVPKVYGSRLRLSTLTVLLSCLAAGLLGGVIGVIIVLPLVASYPIIEKTWLRPYLERDTVVEHKQIDREEA